MPNPAIKKIPLLILACFLVANIHAQNSCPPNLDFENGNFVNWVCKTGSVSVDNNGQNSIVLNSTGQVNGRHTIIPSSNTSNDQYGGFPVSCPNGSGYSVKLGNTNSGDEAEGIFYTYDIPATATNFSILYQYAVVLENPGHTPPEQPRFRARVINLTDGDTISCVSFDFTSSANLPGFEVSPISQDVLYKDWTPVSLDLSGYAGKKIQLEFITSDCTLGGHFGYAYVDVNSGCDGSIVGSTLCVGDTTVDLTAPYGFQTYTWYTDISFSQILGTGQILTLNPAPNVGAVFPVIVTPYPGFGCTDTVYATVRTDSKPPSVAGRDTVICRLLQVPIGTAGNPAYNYLWTPANLVSNSHISNPNGFANTFSPAQLVVKTTNRYTGCFAYDTVVITPVLLDTALLFTGPVNYCSVQLHSNYFEIGPQLGNIQWLLNNTPIAGANNNSYTSSSAGAFRAKFTEFGCTDSTRIVNIYDHIAPFASYAVNKDTQCISSNSFIFTNHSGISNSDALSYLWTFGDGSSSAAYNITKNFTVTGQVSVRLIVTSAYNCSDTASGNIRLMPNIDPGFTRDSACTNRVTHVLNTTDEHGNPLVKYLWDFGNGTGSSLKDPLPFIYPQPGIYNAVLKATALGCENDSRSISKIIHVFAPTPGIRYPDFTLPVNYSTMIFARDGVGTQYQWKPSTQLSNPRIKAPYFYGANDVKYLVDITDRHTCITTDSLDLFVMKKTGSYLPNAFTPNGDGLNDELIPYLVGMKSLKRFSIYNRFGNMIFTSTRDGQGWDGTYKGTKVNTGSFVWVLEYIDSANKEIIKKGSVLLIR